MPRDSASRIVADQRLSLEGWKRTEEALLSRLEFERFLFDLSRRFIGLSEEEVDANMASGLAQVGRFLEMDRVTLLELSRDRAALSVAYSWSAPGVPNPPPILTKNGQPWWVGQVLRGEVALASDPDDLPDEAASEREYLRQRGVASAASIPLRVGGEIAGAIAFVTVQRHVSWTEDLVNQLRAVGDILWNALKRRQTMEALVAARETAERALRERAALLASEDRYRGLAEQVVDAIFITDPAGRPLDANQAGCELLGYTLEELKTLRPEDVMAVEDVPKVPDLLQCLHHTHVVRSEWRFRRKNGSVFTAEVSGRQLSDGRLQTVVRDITERKETEQLQRKLHELAMLRFDKADVKELLGAIVEAAIAVAHADFGNIQLLDEKTSTLRIAAHRGFPDWWLASWDVVSGGTALASGKRTIVEDVERSSIFSAADLDTQRRAGIRSIQSTPLVSKLGMPIGMLSTYWKTPCRPEERTLQKLDLLAREAADIIGHARTEAELARQAALLDLAPNCIFVRDRESCITYWNRGATRCYGWNKEEALGKVSHELLQTQFPEPLDRIVDIVKTTGHWEGELIQTRRDGERMILDSRWAIERRGAGNGFLILEVNTDITASKQAAAALRESEQQLQSYIDQAGDAIYVLDAESGRILNANTRATQMLGYTRDELLQLSATDIEVSQTPEEMRAIQDGAKQRVMQVEGVHRRKDGSTLPVELRVTSLAPTPPYRILAIARDVSERNRLEEERAEEARRKDEFMAFMGHELRNPLAAIQTAVQVLARGPTPAQRARMEELIGRQTTVMRRLVEDLLERERITHGHIELRLTPQDLAECLHRAAAAVQSIVDGRHQTLLLKLPPAPVLFMGDGTRLDQIVGNLLRNASKYTKAGGTIELSGAREGADVVIRCKDNGQGIAREYQQRIFQPFSRGPKTELGYGEASVGLGLALVKQLTELHGGTISVESEGEGHGSEFTVRLPLVSPPSVQAVHGDEPAPRRVTRPRSVVVVEDNPSVAAALDAALTQAGHSVRLFTDGLSALDGLSSLKPDALLIDIGLPGMNGYELADRLRGQTNTKGALFVAISGFRRRDRAMGGDSFDHYFNKPIDVAPLLALIEQR